MPSKLLAFFLLAKRICLLMMRLRHKLTVLRSLANLEHQVKAEVWALIFHPLYHFTGEWISNKKISSAYGLKFYFQKPKAFLLELFIALQIRRNISVQILIANLLSTVSSENKECILTGDMNCNFLVNSDHKDLKSILVSFGLKQLITTPTRITPESETLIDVICTNEPHHIYCTKVIPADLSDHELIGCARKLHNVKYQPRVITCRNYANYNPQLFCDDLRSKVFGNVFTSSCLNTAWAFLKNSLQQCIDKHTPLIEKKVKRKVVSMADFVR